MLQEDLRGMEFLFCSACPNFEPAFFDSLDQRLALLLCFCFICQELEVMSAFGMEQLRWTLPCHVARHSFWHLENVSKHDSATSTAASSDAAHAQTPCCLCQHSRALKVPVASSVCGLSCKFWHFAWSSAGTAEGSSHRSHGLNCSSLCTIGSLRLFCNLGVFSAVLQDLELSSSVTWNLGCCTRSQRSRCVIFRFCISSCSSLRYGI